MTTAILVGGGSGARLGGDVPKALRHLGGRPLIFYTLATLEQTDAVHSVVVVVPGGYEESARADLRRGAFPKVVAVVAGGPERQDSVERGLAAVPTQSEWVVVHDAARPFASAVLFARVIRAAQTHGAAIAAVPAADTLKRGAGDAVLETVPRSDIWHAQTPQVFRTAQLAAGLAATRQAGSAITDDAEAVERLGIQVHLVEGDRHNFKISTPADWAYAKFLVARGTDRGA